MAKRGRKTKYDEDMPHKVRELAGKGLLDYEIFQSLGIGRDTFYLWLREKPEFSDAYKKGKEDATDLVENALFKSTQGFMADGKYIAPSQTAQIFWLKNKRPDKWSDKKEVEHSGEVKQTIINVKEIDGSEDEEA